MSSNHSSNTAVTLTVGILAAAFGLGIGHLSAKYDGISGTADISHEIAAADLDSTTLPIAGSPTLGGVNAAATVVFFADFQCKASRELYGRLMNDVFKTHGNNVKLVYKAFPLSSHELAPFAAQAAYAAHQQGKFWEMFDAIYQAANADSTGKAYLSPENLREYAKKIGLDLAKYDATLNSPDTLAAIQKDIALGQRLDIHKTPSVFINGKPLTFTKGVNADELLAGVNAEIKHIDGLLSKPNAKYYIAQLLNGENMQPAPTDLGRSMKGNPNALVTIVEFSDYECPFCSKVEPTVARILQEYPNDVRVIFTHNPLAMHKNAPLAAQAAYSAGLQNKFWEMHNLLFANQRHLTRENILKYAADLKLDQAKFLRDLDAPSTVAVIESNKAEAQKFGFTGTPAFLVNNQPLSGAQPYENFKKAIDEELAEAKALAQKSGLTGDALYQELMKSYKPAPKSKKRPGNAKQGPEGKIFVDINGAPSLGDENAPVVLVEFTDFECPFCSRANATIKQLLENNPGKVRIVFKHNPLSMHKNARLAHQAAEAAALQGKFWDYYQLLFDNQKALSRENLIDYAAQLGLDVAAFEKDLDSDTVKNRVAADLSQSESVKVEGTPHFFLNGTRLSGARPLEDFQLALNKELDIAKSYTDKGLTGEALYSAIIADGKLENRRLLRGPRALDRARNSAPIQIDTAGNYTKGAEDAPITIIQFSDFQCPFCKTAEPTIDRIMKEYEGKIHFVFLNKPLPFHADAKLAAEAALAAGEQGKFWEMHDLLFKNNKALRREHLNIYADQLGLDRAKFDEALDTHKFLADVEKDIARAASANIDTTPTFIINGKLFAGDMPYEDFKRHIDRALDPAPALQRRPPVMRKDIQLQPPSQQVGE